MFINLFLRIGLSRQDKHDFIMKTILKLANDQQVLKYQLVANSIPYTIRWKELKKEDLNLCIDMCIGRYHFSYPFLLRYQG